MRETGLLLCFLLLPALPACNSTASTEEEILAGTVDTAEALGDAGEFLFWEVPKFILYRVPRTILYDWPRGAIHSLRNNRAKVEALIVSLEENDLTIEEEASVSTELRDLTDLPIESTERWKEWWHSEGGEPERRWRENFVTGAIRRLESDDYFTRAMAIEDLRRIYRMDLDYDPKALPEGRAAGAAKWRAHYRRRGLPQLP